jgi:hypothetical protein
MTLRPKTPKQWVHILHDANDYINESINIVKESIIDATEMCYYNSNECIDTTDNIEQYSSAFNHVWSDDPFFDYVLNISVKNAIQKFGKEIAFESITKELEQLHGSKSLRPTWQGVHYKNLSEKEKRSIIRSHMFLKEKYFQTGKFEKLKARLVGGGHMQDKSLYNEYETASPTVSTTSVFLLATIAATERRQVATIDIPGAYLHAQLDPQSPPIHMSLDKIMTEALCHIDPTFKQFVRHDKTSIVKLTRAIYGLLESAKLWNKDISSTLVNNGFQLNPHDDCVFNKMHNNNQISIAIHVDDLFITCKTVDGINYVRNILELKYGNIQFNHDPTSPISYLGMIFDFSTPGVVSISQPKFINDLLHSQSESRTASTPASSDLFHIDESTLLQPKQQDTYHSVSASLLYLAKRTRPDILLAVSYLSTRVGKANMSDYNKLNRVLRYLNSTRHLCLRLSCQQPCTVILYADASFAIHHDFKSHTGASLTLGKGFFQTKSGRQSIVCKSSTEAELVSQSDSLSPAIWARNFLAAQGIPQQPILLQQDNISAITLTEKGKSTSDRTKHISVRYFWIKDLAQRNEVKLNYVNTNDMIADLLTKPLQGLHFMRLRNLLLGYV